MEQLSRNELLGALAEYAALAPMTALVAATAWDSERDYDIAKVWSAILKEFQGKGIQLRFRGFVFVTPMETTSVSDKLKAFCESGDLAWHFVVTEPNLWPTFDRAMSKVEWRANKNAQIKPVQRVALLVP